MNNTKFKLFTQTKLSSDDYKVLSLLYQPLIGMDGYALYITLYELIQTNKEEFEHKVLIDMFNIKRKKFVETKEKLEAVGLLETYKKNNEYLYVLKTPFTAKQFLLDTILGTYLESEIGQYNMEFITELFKVKKPCIKEHENITKSFDDLYHFKTLDLLKLDFDVEGRNGSTQKLIRNEMDYELFVNNLPRVMQNSQLLNENFKKQIMQISYVYQFNVEDMIKVYENAYTGRGEVTISQLNFQAKQLYEKNNKQVVVAEKELDEVDVLRNTPHIAIIQKFSQQNYQGIALSTVNEFITRNDIDPGVLNVLLIFIFKNKDGILPHVNYLDKVWASWSNNGVQTVEDAINHRQTIEKKWASNNKGYQKKTVNQPEWLDEYIKEISEMEG